MKVKWLNETSSINPNFSILQVPQFKFYEEIRKFEKIDSNDDRRKKAREIYDTFIMRELLSNSGMHKSFWKYYHALTLAFKNSKTILSIWNGRKPLLLTESQTFKIG